MSKNEVVFEVLQATGLNWTVSKKPLNFKGDNGGDIIVPDQFVTVRSDNELPLGVVGNQYTVLQNHETVEMVYKAGEEVFNKDLNVSHPWDFADTLGSYGNMAGGSLKEGRAVFVQLELPKAHIGRSDINRFITITNHHNGSKALGFGTTNQVVCCENTFAIANKSLSKIRHTASMTERVQEAVTSLRVMLQFEEQQMDIFHKASKIPFENKHIRAISDVIFGKDILEQGQKEVSTRLKNQVDTFSGDILKSVDEQGESLWALFNAVTRYTNHSRSTKDKAHSLMFGTDARINQKAYALLDSWV